MEHLTLDGVRLLAHAHHHGQTDKQGRPYYDAHLRPIAEALAPFGDLAEQAGWLHDIVEDTEMTLPELTALNVHPEVVAAVDAVTRRHEPYSALIRRASRHPLGALVKLADNTWNVLSNPSLALVDPARARSLLDDRYLPARRTLIEASGLDALAVHDMEMVLRRHLRRLD